MQKNNKLFIAKIEKSSKSFENGIYKLFPYEFFSVILFDNLNSIYFEVKLKFEESNLLKDS
jgi:hypothetical protein